MQPIVNKVNDDDQDDEGDDGGAWWREEGAQGEGPVLPEPGVNNVLQSSYSHPAGTYTQALHWSFEIPLQSSQLILS